MERLQPANCRHHADWLFSARLIAEGPNGILQRLHAGVSQGEAETGPLETASDTTEVAPEDRVV